MRGDGWKEPGPQFPRELQLIRGVFRREIFLWLSKEIAETAMIF